MVLSIAILSAALSLGECPGGVCPAQRRVLPQAPVRVHVGAAWSAVRSAPAALAARQPVRGLVHRIFHRGR